MSKPNISVSARLFHGVLFAISTEETRYYLRGVYIEPHPISGALLVATDGHRLIVAHDAGGRCAKPAIIEADKSLKRSLGATRKAELVLTVDNAGIVTLPGHYQSAGSCIIDGTYPDWRRVMLPLVKHAKSKAAITPASYNPKYLGDFAIFNERTGHKGGAIRVLHRGDEADPALILFGKIPHAFGVLMPVHQGDGQALPAWMQPVLNPPKPAEKKKDERKAAARPAKPAKISPKKSHKKAPRSRK